MLSTIFWVAVGAFLGWNLPQPTWAETVQDKITGAVKRLTGR